ncbi:MAG: right-handed parallel beta-helix repeat-containing protein [Bacteroidetes bacterium]|nr:right-handed parallel beta-helix repeat-containing protein [Bacteroidota bacterium]
MKKLLLFSALGTLAIFACKSQRELPLTAGMTIRESITVSRDTFRFNAADSLRPTLTIEGENITVDFNGAVLDGGGQKDWPDQFTGTGIFIKGKNITLKNAVVRGFKVGVLAEGVDSLRLLDCDFSYNWRPRLRSIREREDFSDWLSFHQNDKDEWVRYGAGMYLKNCQHALVQGCTVTQGMNGLLLSGCNDGLFYNNSLHFNSGLGVGMYRSSRNRLMHNKLDWNVRGYSHGFYQRGQDSAGILVYEQSSENTFAYNSATHSGDGFFLWAGQTTMDTGKGGCNDNLLYRNDFSHAPTNGVEVTFSRNKIVDNRIDDCTYGIWGGYSYGSLILGNQMEGCRTGIAIEHGQENAIVGNKFVNDSVGVQLWARASQPTDWGYAKNRDVASRDYQIGHNRFEGVRNPLKISASKKVAINDDNQFAGFEKLLVAEQPNEAFYFVKNEVEGDRGWHDAEGFKNMNPIVQKLSEPHFPIGEIQRQKVEKLPDGMNASLPANHLRGRQYILVDEWGPCDFRSPSVWLRTIEGDQYTFLLVGPPEGNWKIVDGGGWASLNQQTGSFPVTLVATKSAGAEALSLNFEFIGEAFTDRFGHFNKKGKPFPFRFERFEKKLDWQVRWYNYDEAANPLTHYEVFKNLKNKPPQRSAKPDELYFAWWGSPAEGVAEDNFATFAEAVFDIAPGTYRLSLTSDDGAKLFLDGKPLIDHWDIHEPATDEVEVKLGGQHHLEVEHFEGGGFGTLDFRMRKVGG